MGDKPAFLNDDELDDVCVEAKAIYKLQEHNYPWLTHTDRGTGTIRAVGDPTKAYSYDRYDNHAPSPERQLAGRR